MKRIHPTAVVDPAAELGDDVVVGPLCVIDGPVKVGARTVLPPHVTRPGNTVSGERNVIHAGAVNGELDAKKTTQEEILYLAAGYNKLEGKEAPTLAAAGA